jgi:hypothetical protein
MNQKILLCIQLALMGLFFYLIFGVFDAKQTSGLIGIGASMIVIFGIVLFLEKIKEKMEQSVNIETSLEQPQATTAVPSTPVAPTATQPKTQFPTSASQTQPTSQPKTPTQFK